MKNAVLMRVVHGARDLRHQLRCLPNRHWRVSDHFVKLAALDQLHAEVALAIALAHLVDRNDARMLEVSGGFGFPAEALQMSFRGPRAAANHFKRDAPIETLLMGSINYRLTAPADFL